MIDESIIKFPDMLRIKGVMAKGYGIICKFPMTDPDLKVTAKTIYAYLCAYIGNGTTAFPSVSQIIDHLQISKDSYYKGMKQLKEQGYITVKKKTVSNGQFANNEYTIETNPKKFVEAAYSSDGGTLHSTIGFSGIKSAGYGLIPRIVMYDTRLTSTAKVIYAYLASFSGAGKVAFPEKKHIQYHLGIGNSTYKTHMRLLVSTNYITIIQRHVNGKLGANDYYLNDHPDEASTLDSLAARHKKNVITGVPKKTQRVKKQDTVQQVKFQDMVQEEPVIQDAEHQETVNQETDIQEAAHQDAGCQEAAQKDTIKNSFLINSSLNISPSINKAPEHWTDGMSWGELVDYIECELDPDITCHTMNIPLSREDYDFVVQVIAEFICSGRKKLRIRGVEHDRGEVIDKLLELNLDDYAYIIEKIKSVKGTIKNVRSYCLVCLYSAKEDHNVELSRQIAQDFKHG